MKTEGTAMPRTARTARRSASAAALLACILGSGAVLTAAPSAFAESAPSAGITLSANTPASVGFAGQPVEFTETIDNTGTPRPVALELDATTGPGVPENGLVMQFLEGSTWKDLALTYDVGQGRFEGRSENFHLAVGQRTLKLRIGLPMGTPFNGASNGGTQSIKLHSAVADAADEWNPLAEDTHTIGVTSISSSVSHVPATVVAGGAPIEFDATLSNPTPSDYVRLGNVLFIDAPAKVQVRTGNGAWTTLGPIQGRDRQGFYLDGESSSAKAGTTHTVRVRLSYPSSAKPGKATISPCVFVNEGRENFRGTTLCSRSATVTIAAGPSAGASPSQSATPTQSAAPSQSATPTQSTTPTRSATPSSAPSPAQSTSPAPAAAPVTPASSSGGDELAHTGAGSSTLPLALGSAALVAGGAALLVFRRRRSA
ncbi:LPXTG cell wall anchor domain-containing protein [Peterkaempfera bronchialis]|uniref:LPXTG cell wall anchor domain-containing protein n=1 Tax=Peterkaempfera bronchialis TaxID=2126346 RepID=A0A345T1P9_9ACTN|nr:LPXTG cell wall anchor domain-containing protein [Peterkaempfera bronchialis]AXI79904.1 LPXTG cell wall anchor domain-containing protein [Peterkaempfera bronchialis]